MKCKHKKSTHGSAHHHTSQSKTTTSSVATHPRISVCLRATASSAALVTASALASGADDNDNERHGSSSCSGCTWYRLPTLSCARDRAPSAARMRRLNELTKRDDDDDDEERDEFGADEAAETAVSEFKCDGRGCCKNTMVACSAGLQRKRVKSAVTMVEMPIAPALLDASTLRAKCEEKHETNSKGSTPVRIGME